MEGYICKTCAVQHAPSESPPDRCIICEDDRQYVGWGGQQWTTLAELQAAGYKNEFREIEPGLMGIGVQPHLGIGQRALLVQTPQGNALWDGIGYIDDQGIARARELGGIQALAASHPHFYGCMVEWSQALGGAPIYIPRADAEWFVRPHPAVVYWEGAVELFPGITLIQCGGHFPGSAAIHWAEGADGRGALLTGDTIAVVQDRNHVSFMYSYPNLIPTDAAAVRGIVEAVRPYKYDRIYGGWWPTVCASGGERAVASSARRYIEHLGGG